MEWLATLYLVALVGIGVTPKPAMQILLGSVWVAFLGSVAWALLHGLFTQL